MTMTNRRAKLYVTLLIAALFLCLCVGTGYVGRRDHDLGRIAGGV